MAVIVIVHERRGNAIKPKDDAGDKGHTKNGNTRVPEQSSVKFTTVAGVVGTEIIFENDSPFDPQKRVPYGPEIKVTATFNETNPAKNRYVYRCHGFANGTPLDSKDGGGEMEIIR